MALAMPTTRYGALVVDGITLGAIVAHWVVHEPTRLLPVDKLVYCFRVRLASDDVPLSCPGMHTFAFQGTIFRGWFRTWSWEFKDDDMYMCLEILKCTREEG